MVVWFQQSLETDTSLQLWVRIGEGLMFWFLMDFLKKKLFFLWPKTLNDIKLPWHFHWLVPRMLLGQFLMDRACLQGYSLGGSFLTFLQFQARDFLQVGFRKADCHTQNWLTLLLPMGLCWISLWLCLCFLTFL